MDDPALQWAAADGRQRAAAMSPYQAAPAPAPGRRTGGGRSRSRPPRSTARPRWSPRWPVCPAREVPGLRMVLRPQFDLTPETALAGAAAGAGWRHGAAGGGAGLEPGPVR